MNTIGERIVFLREEREISQKSLALTIGLAPTSLSRYENNIYEPKAEIISRLAKALSTSSDFLLGLKSGYELIPSEQSITTDFLSLQEYRLLKYYRLLNPENKARVDERIKALSEIQN